MLWRQIQLRGDLCLGRWQGHDERCLAVMAVAQQVSDEALAAGAQRLPVQLAHETLDALTQARDHAPRELRVALDLLEHRLLWQMKQQRIAARLSVDQGWPLEEHHRFAEALPRT